MKTDCQRHSKKRHNNACRNCRILCALLHRAQLDRLAEMQSEPRGIGTPGRLGGGVRERGGVVRVPPEDGVTAFRRGGCLSSVLT